ncbi:MAG: stringent starvation protein A [Gammaproteobacteria bacterium]|nr:stringent starvation protein A [Gammaproteobacteria bacterium]
MAIVTKRTVMTLYTDLSDVYSHQVRIVLAEKGVNVEILPVNPASPSEDLLLLNPYGSVPTLLDRDLVLFESRIIMEYLDERFPHPPLLPVYPVARAESRKMMFRIEQDWYQLMAAIFMNDNVDETRADLKASLMSLEPIFADKPYFLSDEFSLLDCVMTPLLWRLPALGIEIDASAKGLHAYMQRLFARDAFKNSLTEIEKQMRVA